MDSATVARTELVYLGRGERTAGFGSGGRAAAGSGQRGRERAGAGAQGRPTETVCPGREKNVLKKLYWCLNLYIGYVMCRDQWTVAGITTESRT